MTSSRTAPGSVPLDDLDRRIINGLQDGLPLVPEPFAVIAADLGCETDDLIRRIERLLGAGVLTRFGPFYDAAAMGGAFCLCAMAIPSERFDEAASVVNGFAEVAHNYARDHALNMWFVLATETPGGIDAAIARIEAETALPVYPFPKLKEYFVEMKLKA